MGIKIRGRDTLFFHEELLENGKVTLKGLTHENLLSVREVFSQPEKLFEKVLGLLLETKEESNYVYKIAVVKEAKKKNMDIENFKKEMMVEPVFTRGGATPVAQEVPRNRPTPGFINEEEI